MRKSLLSALTWCWLLAPAVACQDSSTPSTDDDDDDDGDDDDDATATGDDDDDDDGSNGDDDDDDDDDDTTTDSGETTDSGVELSLAKDIQPIFDATCGCHTKDDPAAGLSLKDGETHKAMVGVENKAGLVFVKVKEPDESYLVNKLENTQGSVDGGAGQVMPPKKPLSDDEIELVREWIRQGAKP